MGFRGLLGTVALGGFALWAVAGTDMAPGLRTSIEKGYRSYIGWTDEARREDPAGYLVHAKSLLRDDLAEIEGVIQEVGDNRARVNAELASVQRKRQAVAELLQTGKGRFQKASAQSRWPVNFAGGHYKPEEMKAQLKILFLRAASLERQQEGLDESLGKLTELLSHLHAKRAEVQDILGQVETSVVLAKAQAVTENVRDTSSKAAEVLDDVGGLLGRYRNNELGIRSAEALIAQARAEQEKGSTTGEFEKFLSE